MSFSSCPVCRSKAHVTDTRRRAWYVYRRYRCEEAHSYSTREILDAPRTNTELQKRWERRLREIMATRLRATLSAAIDTFLTEDPTLDGATGEDSRYALDGAAEAPARDRPGDRPARTTRG